MSSALFIHSVIKFKRKPGTTEEKDNKESLGLKKSRYEMPIQSNTLRRKSTIANGHHLSTYYSN